MQWPYMMHRSSLAMSGLIPGKQCISNEVAGTNAIRLICQSMTEENFHVS